MGCWITGLPDFILAIFAIVGFSSSRNPVLHRSPPWALGAGVSLFITSILEAVGITFFWISALEFFIILIAATQIERFVSINTGKKPLYWLFGMITLLTVFTAIVTENPTYFEAGLLTVLGTAAVRFSSTGGMLFGTEIKLPPCSPRGAMAFLSALSLVPGFRMLSAFLYTGALILLILTIAENIMGIT
ncbi:hypothetical protein [Thermococcus peptonophilus]|uniref:hypothetical protein n=1 Tax=Thermococcus peptonophilus TaxID=53952 RepID=UPI0006D0841C